MAGCFRGVHITIAHKRCHSGVNFALEFNLLTQACIEAAIIIIYSSQVDCTELLFTVVSELSIVKSGNAWCRFTFVFAVPEALWKKGIDDTSV